MVQSHIKYARDDVMTSRLETSLHAMRIKNVMRMCENPAVCKEVIKDAASCVLKLLMVCGVLKLFSPRIQAET